MITKRFLVLLITLLASGTLFACSGDKAIETLVITEGLKIEYEIGEQPDFSAVKALATYNDGTSVELSATDLTFGEVNTATVGTKNLDISYKNFVITVSIIVKGKTLPPQGDNNESEDGSQLYITSVSLPDSLALLEINKKDFLDKTVGYLVGDDNPFYFRLKLNVFTSDGNKVNVTNYTSSSYVYLADSTTPLEGEELLKYVVIDENENSFDFTEDAIGKAFTITTKPQDDLYASISEDITKSLTVTVVDGYNVYEAYELNYITNNNTLDSTLEIPNETRGQAEIVDAFLQNEKHVTRPTIASIVLHNNLDILPTDLPSDYFVDKDRTKEIYDGLSIFSRILSVSEKVFTIHGNYFAIYSHNLPSVSNEGSGTISDMVSSSPLVSFISNAAVDKYYNHRDYVATVSNVIFVGNSPASDNESTVEQSLNSLLCLRANMVTLNVNNSKIQSYYISINGSNDYTTININDSQLYNSYQSHLYLISNNPTQEDTEEPLAEGYPNLTVNITSSKVMKSGGPAIISQSYKPALQKNKHSGVNVNICAKSTVESWITGEEAWFKHTGLTFVATQIKNFDRLLLNHNSSIIREEVRTVNGKPTTFKLINIIMINLPQPDISGGIPGITEDLMGKTDIDGKLVIGNKTVMNMDDCVVDGVEYNFADPTISDIKSSNLSSQIATTPSGAVAYTTPNGKLQVEKGDITANGSNDYLAVYYYSLCLVFGNYHQVSK